MRLPVIWYLSGEDNLNGRQAKCLNPVLRHLFQVKVSLSVALSTLVMSEAAANSVVDGNPQTSSKPSIASRSALGAAILVLNQIGTRALTFAVNQVLFRYLSPGIYGVATQLELFSVSILYFSRESLRVALQRQQGVNKSQKDQVHGAEFEEKSTRPVVSYGPARRIQEVVNLSHIALGLGLPLTVLFSWLYLRSADIAVLETNYLIESLRMYAVATILELLVEPCFAVAKQQMLDGTRAWAEFRASLIKCLVTCATAIWASRTGRDLGVLPFAMGQLSYAVILNVVYLWTIGRVCAQNAASLFPTVIPGDKYLLSRFSRPLIIIAATFYGQAIFNQILTSGDSYLIAALAPLPAQGAYALASNYGGLLARMLFQPIEESSRSLFGRLPPAHTTPSASAKSADATALKQATGHLTVVLHFYSLLSLLAISLGPPLSPLLLRTLAGSRWTTTEAPAVLAAYCYLIPLLAANGILEAFVAAVATPAQIRAQSLWKAGQLCAFAGTCYVALRVAGMGAEGLVVANAVAMGCRILWSWVFVGDYLGEEQGLRLKEVVPSTGSMSVAFGAKYALIILLQKGSDAGLVELAEGAVVVGACGLGL